MKRQTHYISDREDRFGLNVVRTKCGRRVKMKQIAEGDELASCKLCRPKRKESEV